MGQTQLLNIIAQSLGSWERTKILTILRVSMKKLKVWTKEN